MSCLKPNFGILDVIGLSEEALGAHNIDDMLKNIIESIYENASSYSLSEEESLKPEEFKQSIDTAIGRIMEKVAAMDSTIPELQLKEGETHYEIIKENLKSHFYERGNITREEEVDLSAVIDGQLMSREEIAAQRLNRVLDTFFSGNNAAKETFKKKFARELGLSVVIRIGQTLKDSIIVDDERTLNENIEKFQADQYLILYRYLKSLGLAKGIPNSMFRSHKPLGTYTATLDRFYNLVLHKSRIGTLEDDVEQGWKAVVEQKQDPTNPSLYDAINAYLSIVYFDKLSQESIGKYISIDKNLDQPINVDSDGLETYKYKFGKDTENRVHGWQVDVRDALKEMGNFSKFLISSIPIDDTYLTPVNYLDTFTT